ncbi:MAG TPA: alpha/beta hydrolase [Rhizobiaceae bacterium]|nr:alpha/beta hydrolase [Rhizobiaceae bacterium]
MTAEIRQRLAAIGTRFDIEVAKETRALYRPLLTDDGEGISVRPDIAYGPGERQKLDLYATDENPARRRILLFVPGGGFVAGSKDGRDGFYANLGRHFARRGFVVAVMDYRLAPAHRWPAGHKDVGLAVRWLQENADELGANAQDVSVFGQSAGAAHTLAWFFDPQEQEPKGISSVVLASGVYCLHAGNLAANIVAYFSDDPETFAERSPLSHVRRSDTPFLLLVSQFDPAILAVPTFELAAKLWEVNGTAPRFALLEGHNHVSPVLSIGTEDSGCASIIQAFLRDNAKG